jgi:hypothetical protein
MLRILCIVLTTLLHPSPCSEMHLCYLQDRATAVLCSVEARCDKYLTQYLAQYKQCARDRMQNARCIEVPNSRQGPDTSIPAFIISHVDGKAWSC